MNIYVDSSAIVKRAIDEPESDDLELELSNLIADGAALETSALAIVEVSRTVRRRHDLFAPDLLVHAIDQAFAGFATLALSEDVLGYARRLDPRNIRSLDAFHLASAVVLGADLFIAYDRRLLAAASELGFSISSPGQ